MLAMDWVAVALEEYKTLRTESLAAIEHMQRTMQIGLVAIGVLTAFAVDAADSGVGVQAGLATATPAFAAFILVMWLDELRRTVVAGAHIAKVECRIRHRYENDDPPLSWETNIQKTYPLHGYRWVRQWSTAGAVFAATAPVIAIGLVRVAQVDEWTLFLAACLAIVMILVLSALYQASVHRDMSKLTDETRVAIGLLEEESEEVRRNKTRR
jgi:uncharacterized membrane protein YhiD involved in acid resistance